MTERQDTTGGGGGGPENPLASSRHETQTTKLLLRATKLLLRATFFCFASVSEFFSLLPAWAASQPPATPTKLAQDVLSPAHSLACYVASGIENGPFLSSFFLSATRRRSGCSTGDDQRWHPSQLDPPPGGGACACRYLRFYQLQPAR